MLPFDDLWPLLFAHAPRLGVETMPLLDVGGRVLAAPALAAWDLPRFDNSAMDGFAVRAADVAGAAATTPVVLDLAGAAYAGPGDGGSLAAGLAMRIGTGAPLPAGADAVVAQEDTETRDGRVLIRAFGKVGQHIRRQGEECTAGQAVLPAGASLTPYSIAALLAAGVARVEVYKKPRVAIVVTGDELVAAGQTPGPGQLVETNGTMLKLALEKKFGIVAAMSRLVADDLTATTSALRDALDRHDLVVSTGGVSVGDRDYIKEAAEAIGAERLVWRVAMKPGKPLYIAKRGQALLVGLPGNPAAVGVAIAVVLAPLLSAMAGQETLPPRLPIRLTRPLKRSTNRTDLRWATLHWTKDGHVEAAPLAKAGSHMLGDLAVADALVVVPPGPDELPAGAELIAILLT